MRQANDGLSIARVRGLLLAAVLMVACASTARAQSADPLVRIAGHVPSTPQSTMQMGPVEANRTIDLAITLPMRDRAGADALVRRLYDSSDPLYGKYLSPSQIADQFGPTPQDYAAVVNFARAHGLIIKRTHVSRQLVDVEGPAATVETAFGVQLNYYEDWSGHTFYAPDADPALPASLAAKVRGIVGLDDTIKAYPDISVQGLQEGATANPDSIGSGIGGTMSPSDIHNAYELGTVAENGTGQTLGLFELDSYTPSDIAEYETYYSLPSVPLTNIIVDSASTTPGSGAVEDTLDIELMAALAPHAAGIDVFIGPNDGQGILDTYTAIYEASATIKAISSSWGGPESTGDTFFYQEESDIFEDMALAGQSIFAASGDKGAYAGGGKTTLSIQDPSSQPYVTGVGGTTLTVTAPNGPWSAETTWANTSNNEGGGGGVSLIWPLPWYQSALPSSTNYSTTMRDVPDVALNSDPRTGYSLYYDGGWYFAGGTSAAAPLWAAFTSLVNERRGANDLGVIGFLNPSLYAIGEGGSYNANLHDINDNSTNFYWHAVTGYDCATGWGSFNGQTLLSTLASPAVSTDLTATAGNAQVTLSWTNASGATSYSVYRGTVTGGEGTTPIATGIATASYTNTGLTNGTTYYYTVAAVNLVGAGPSNEASARPMPPLPSAPASLTATGGNAQVTLGWTAGSDATSYSVYRGTTAGGEAATAITTGIAGTSYTDTSVSNGTTYYYTVAGVNMAGTSGPSNEVSATPLAPNPTVATPAAATPNPVIGTSAGLSVLGAYAGAGGESALTYTWSATGPASVSYSSNGANASKNSTATFSAAGAYTLTVTIADASGGKATSSVNVTVSQTVTSIAVSPNPVTLDVSGGDTFTAVAYDQFGTALGTQPTVAWSLDNGSVGGINSSTGVYSAGLAPGSATIRATSGSVSGTASVTVIDPGPTVAEAAGATPDPVTGSQTALSVLGSDLAGESTLTYTWSSTGPASVSYGSNGTNASQNTTATFSTAGAYVITVTIANPYGETVTSMVNVTVSQTLTSIVVSPNPVTLNLGGGDTFTAIAYDQFGTALGTQPAFAWSLGGGSVGSIDPSTGIYAAGLTPGSATVCATSGPVSGSGSVAVTDPGPTVSTAASATPNPVTGAQTALSVLGADLAGESTLTYTWSATGPSTVTYSDNGDNSAKNTTATFSAAGAYAFTVTIANPYGGTITSSVNVTVSQTLASMTVTPGPALALTLVTTQQFTATGMDQFGNVLSTQPAFGWTLLSGGVGSIGSASGLYHTGQAPGTATIKAKFGSLSAACVITVTAPLPTVATPASATPNPITGTSTNLSARGAYSGPTGAASLIYTWSETSGPPGVTFSVNGTNAAENTTATFTQAGSYTLQATIANPYGGSVTSSVNVTVSQTLTSITVTPDPITVSVNGGQAFTATANDQFGNALATQPVFTWSVVLGSVGSINASTGVYAAGAQTGSATVRAAVGSVNGTAQVTVTASAPPTVATPASANPATVTGTTTALSVLGADVNGESTLTYTWAATGAPPAPVAFSVNGTNAAKNTTATFVKAGSYTLQATITDAYGQSTTSAVTVTVNQTFTSIVTSPGPTLTINPPLPVATQFTATALDQFGSALATQPAFTWSVASGGVGSITVNGGLYHSGTVSGSATIKAKSGGLSGTCAVTVD